MRRKNVTSIGIVALLISLVGLGTAAYFVTIETAYNSISTGGVDIAIRELGAPAGEPEFNAISVIRPGKIYHKAPYVENVDTSDAWLRGKIILTETTMENETREIPLNQDLISINLDTENWELHDGYYYYKKALKQGETTEPIFTQVVTNDPLPPEFEYSTFNLSVNIDAVQAAHNGESPLEAVGWDDGEEE